MLRNIPPSPGFGNRVALQMHRQKSGAKLDPRQSGGWGEEGETSQELWESMAGRKLYKNKPCGGSLLTFPPFLLTQFA